MPTSLNQAAYSRAGKHRFLLLAFGSLLLALFVVLAIGEGVGNPSVPSGDVAIVEDTPEGLGTISETTSTTN